MSKGNTVLPDNILRCMTPEARKALGQKTAEEVLAQGEAKSEKELQRSIVALLRLKGIEVNVSRMDKRKTDAVGWPDLTFAVDAKWEVTWGSVTRCCSGILACAWEIKMPQGRLTPEQEAMATSLSRPPNHWRHRVIRSVDEAIAELREMGIE